MSDASTQNSWHRAGKATLAGLGLLVVVTLMLVSSTGDPEEKETQRAELKRAREEAERLNAEGHELAARLKRLSESVGWKSRSEQGKASQPSNPLLEQIVDGARIHFYERERSPAWKELESMTDEELIAEVRSIREQLERRQRAGRNEPPPDLAQRLDMAISIMDSRGIEPPRSGVLESRERRSEGR